MHAEAFAYVARWASDEPISVVEFGARHTWGPRVRSLFPNAAYVGVDAVEGTDVDVVANAATWRPVDLVDVVICCEVFEHTPHWRQIVLNASRALRPGGRAIFTCAGPGRAVHGVGEDDPDRAGHYRNVGFGELADEMRKFFLDVEAREEAHRSTALGGTDTFATGVWP